MECPLCETSMREYRDRYECTKHHIIYWKNHSTAGTPANLYPHKTMTLTEKLLEPILNFKWKPEYLILLSLALAYGLCMIWIGMLLNPRVIG